ncbi:MAG: hypothetical protein AB7V77_03060 [Candidatus Woesearchaeota archaeon]
MEDISIYRQKTLKTIEEAEDLLYRTYALTKDNKLFLTIILKLFSSLEYLLNTVLNDKIGSKDSFLAKVSILRQEKSKLSEDDFEFFTFIKNLMEEHKLSSMEFARKEKFVITDENYNLHTLTYENLEEYLNTTKKIIAQLLMEKY